MSTPKKHTSSEVIERQRKDLIIMGREHHEVTNILFSILHAVTNGEHEKVPFFLKQAHDTFKCYEETGTSPSVWNDLNTRKWIEASWAEREEQFKLDRGPDAFAVHAVTGCGNCGIQWVSVRDYRDTEVECPKCKALNSVI